jgi:hypothetical protein
MIHYPISSTKDFCDIAKWTYDASYGRKLAAVFCILCSLLGITKSCAQVLQEKVHISAPIEEAPSIADRGFDDFIHFQLYLTDAKREWEVRNALHYFSKLESYRFVSERRRIYFSDDLGFVE